MTDAISTKVGPVPIAFVAFVVCALALELGLRGGGSAYGCARSDRTRSRPGASESR